MGADFEKNVYHVAGPGSGSASVSSFRVSEPIKILSYKNKRLSGSTARRIVLARCEEFALPLRGMPIALHESLRVLSVAVFPVGNIRGDIPLPALRLTGNLSHLKILGDRNL